MSLLTGQEPDSPHRPSRWTILLPTTQGSSILRIWIIYALSHLRRKTQLDQLGHMLWQIFKIGQVQATYNGVGLSCSVCQVQGMYTEIYFIFGTDFVQVWIKPNGEMPFLYGNHVLKAHLGRITEDTPEHQGVIVYSMNDIPLVSFKLIRPSFNDLYDAGLRCYCTVNGRHAKVGPNSNHRIPPSVRALNQLIHCFSLTTGLQGRWRIFAWRGMSDCPNTILLVIDRSPGNSVLTYKSCTPHSTRYPCRLWSAQPKLGIYSICCPVLAYVIGIGCTLSVLSFCCAWIISTLTYM